ncbi:YafY family transcriptional regulator [Streptomyces sp. NBC_01335]|uniref:helix-turn-helix transcriptional regulator n=1 Tax=Streptomyces sp. NBC_01335 TaxID=2903828 RepID=UPI002E1229CB|nr:YafY family transcriptional regulator [Streptomyces sp. NBC_01335]
MSRPAGRVLALLELLQSGGVRTTAELAGRLGVDARTVRRYVDHLTDLDVPVETVRGRYGGYRLGPGYRMPPLMFSDDEALAVLLGLIAGRRAGLTTTADTAGETAAAKIRRVLPERAARRLATVLEALAFTDPPGEPAAPDAGVLLTVADAVRHHRPLSIRYTGRDGRRSERGLHPYGIVAHAGRWYVTGTDPGIGEDRSFRLDRVEGARTLPGTFEAPEGPEPAERLLSGFAAAAYRHRVTLRIHGTAERIRARLPATVASLEELHTETGRDGTDGDTDGATGVDTAPGAERWHRVELRVERLDWLPPVLASLDRPFVVERPDELRDLVVAFADRFAARARRT